MEHVFQVSGMTCGHCERAVQNAIAQVDAQAQTQIDRASGKVVVQSTAPREALAQAIQEEGYSVAA
ncbi:heavy-metal-associated domain-containing protein [Comamonas sp.]|uniref:heavy-metal-associated domain-containing protein n=1 Tax=Comamonas sp. TaxID=34028 RepID=UPI0028989335|nr:heavy-metal-associated domain-containing protein [Comamonas sp.]